MMSHNLSTTICGIFWSQEYRPAVVSMSDLEIYNHCSTLRPPSTTVSVSKLTLPRIVLTTDSGCSNIPFCMKVEKLPFMICCISILSVVISRIWSSSPTWFLKCHIVKQMLKLTQQNSVVWWNTIPNHLFVQCEVSTASPRPPNNDSMIVWRSKLQLLTAERIKLQSLNRVRTESLVNILQKNLDLLIKCCKKF